MKILLVYPNHKGMNMLPPAIGLLSACLKRENHTVELFDTTYYNSVEINGNIDKSDSDTSKSDRLMARPYKMPKSISVKYSNVFDDFEQCVRKFNPDLVAMSCTEDMFHLGINLLNRITKFNIKTIVGGVFATFAPKLVLSYKSVDIVCKGEGEDALVELCARMEKNKDYFDIPNLWFKYKGKIISNTTKGIDMDNNPLIDMSLFEDARFYRPMGGKVYRMFPVETHRGCPFKCAYCNSPSQMALYKKEANVNYLRRKNFDNIRKELQFYKEDMKAEYLYFWADTFFSWTRGEFDTFCEIYEQIRLPFWCQTRPETVNEDRLRKLKKIGCDRISFGVEHGNPNFREKYLNRKMSNQSLTNSLNMVRKVGITFSVNNIIGFPYETRDLAFDTINLNKTFEADDRNAYPFTPFTGTPLRKVCEDLGFLKENDIVQSVIANGSLLNMPQFRRDEINGLVKTFNMYVKFPESRWPEIKRAESNTKEGTKIYNDLKSEYLEKFWNNSTSFEMSAKYVDRKINYKKNIKSKKLQKFAS
ncbi:B12-binding domain-containing radical SAM protein [bacterium]|nr:B12-binding domain-containing radical SAM protein [bacterium]